MEGSAGQGRSRDDGQSIPLREHIEALFSAQERLFSADLKALENKMMASFAATDKALEVQAIEYERRLSDLNHEQARLAADRERFLSKEVYDGFYKDFGTWRDAANSFMSANGGRDKGVNLAWTVGLALLGAIGAIVGLYLALRT